MKQTRCKMITVLALIVLLLGGWAKMAPAMGKNGEVLRMAKEELKPMLGRPDVVVVDVRIGKEWEDSKWKIQGAIREDPEKDVKSWASKYPKDKTLVLYCS